MKSSRSLPACIWQANGCSGLAAAILMLMPGVATSAVAATANPVVTGPNGVEEYCFHDAGRGFPNTCVPSEAEAVQLIESVFPEYRGKLRWRARAEEPQSRPGPSEILAQITYGPEIEEPGEYAPSGYAVGGHTSEQGCAPLGGPIYPERCASESESFSIFTSNFQRHYPECTIVPSAHGNHDLPPEIGQADGRRWQPAFFFATYPAGRHLILDWSCPNLVDRRDYQSVKMTPFRCAQGFDAPTGRSSAWPRVCRPQRDTFIITQRYSRPASCASNTRPCFPATGDKARFETDFVFGGLPFTRSWHSIGANGDFPGSPRASMGAGWTTLLSLRVMGFSMFRDANGDVEGMDFSLRRVVDGQEVDVYRSRMQRGRALIRRHDHLQVIEADGRVYRLDLAGRLLEVSDSSDASIGYVLQYDSDARVVALRDRAGRVLRLIYGSAKILIPIIGCERTSQRLDCNTEHRLPRVVRIELPDGQGIDYRYDRWGNLARVDYPDGRSRIYHYGEPDLASTANGYLGMHQLTGISDETGRRVMRFGYTPAGSVRLSEVIASDGGTTERTTLRYLSRTEVETTQPEGYSRRYTISDDPYRRITAIAAPNGTQRWTYDANSLLTERRDANDGLTRYEYRNWEPVAVVEAAGTSQERRIETDLHPLWNQPTERRVKNTAGQLLRRETFTYDAKGALLTASVQDPSSPLIQTTTMTRDPDGRILTIDGPRTDVSDITTYTYFDAEDPACASSPTTCSFRKGDLKSVTNALGHTTHFVRYDGAGRLLESRDANGLVSTFTYTPRGWLASRTVGGLTTSITYTAVGDVESVTTPDGRSLTYTYDTARRLTAVQDQRGNRIEWTLDNAGNRTAEAVKDASGTLRRTLTQQFNTLGRLSQAANAAGRATLFTQDANGNLDLASDPLNRTTDQDVDALDRVTRQLQDVAGLNVETQFGFDALDQLTTVTDPKGLITRYTNDGLGNLLKLESPDTGTTTYTVDAAGNRSSQTDARGITVGYTYDALNRLTGIRFPTAALNTTFVYDSATGCPAGETFALGRLSSMTDASGSTRWCYDLLGRLTRKVQVTNGRTFTTAYAYDAQGRLSTQTLPSGAIVRFGYTSGEVNTVAVRLAGSSVDLPLINGIERLPFGPVSKLTYGNGRTQTRAYDLDYAIDRITSSEASGWTQDYGVDAVGNITAILGTGANNRFRYDGLDRLTHADNTSNVTQRAYPVDKTGNRTGKQTAAGGAITPYVYAATNHRLAQTGTEARTYDAVGNPLTIGTRTLTYDERSRLTVFVNGTTTRRYQYTGQGLRVRKWTSSNTSGNTYFVYNENAQLIGEYDNAGARVQEIVWLGNLPIGVIAGTAAVPVLHYIESDHLGTPRVIVDATRNVGIWRWNQTNDPFGESTPNQNPDGDATSFTFNLRFAGQYRDSESGWYYNVHRYYDPATGRYLESDPIGLNGGISTYGYVGANPLFYVDPLGLEGTRWWDLPGHIQNWGADVANLSRARGEIQGASIGAGQYGYPSPDPAAASRVNDALLERGQQAGTVAAASMSLPLLAELLPASAIRHGLGSAADDVVAACRSPEAREAVFRACVAVNFCDVHTNGRLPKDLPEDGWIQARNIGQEVREAGMREAMRNGQVTYPKP